MRSELLFFVVVVVGSGCECGIFFLFDSYGLVVGSEVFLYSHVIVVVGVVVVVGGGISESTMFFDRIRIT